MKIEKIILATCLLASTTFVNAQTNGLIKENNTSIKPSELSVELPVTTKELTKKIFSQNISFMLPSNFKIIEDSQFEDGYLLKAIPNIQNKDNWRQLITITGEKNAALVKNFNLDDQARLFFNNYKLACEKSFSAGKIPAIDNIDGYRNITLVLRCGNIRIDDKDMSETTIVNFIQGKKDTYTIQYTERDLAKDKLKQYDIDYFAKKNFSIFPIKISN